MVEVRDICFSYGKNAPDTLRGVSFDVPGGTCTAILGNNGAGKSTLLKCIDRILRPKSGEVIVDGKNVFAMSSNEMAQNVAYVAQNARAVDMSVFDTVLLGRKPYIQWDATHRDREIVSDILRRMKLESYALRSVSELSGGEAQKVLIARALAQEPRVLLLDEPTSNLDPRNQHEVMQLVRAIAREHKISVITVLHDLNLAIRYCDRFMFLKDSEIYAHGGREVMSPEIVEHVYDMHVHIVDCMGIPVLIPFPDVKTHREDADGTE